MKVLIADPQPSVRHALSVWINGQLGWNVIGESSDSFDLLEKLIKLTPEIIIMDSDLPGITTRELVAGIRQRSKEVAIILLSNLALEQIHSDDLGVDFIASKIDPPSRILDTLLKGKTWVECKSPDNQVRG